MNKHTICNLKHDNLVQPSYFWQPHNEDMSIEPFKDGKSLNIQPMTHWDGFRTSNRTTRHNSGSRHRKSTPKADEHMVIISLARDWAKLDKAKQGIPSYYYHMLFLFFYIPGCLHKKCFSYQFWSAWSSWWIITIPQYLHSGLFWRVPNTILKHYALPLVLKHLGSMTGKCPVDTIVLLVFDYGTLHGSCSSIMHSKDKFYKLHGPSFIFTNIICCRIQFEIFRKWRPPTHHSALF